jgi:hypothetical protein
MVVGLGKAAAEGKRLGTQEDGECQNLDFGKWRC